LMCGDSTNIQDVEKLMDGKKADMVFTDPPYLITTQWWNTNLWKAFKKTADRIKDIVDFDPEERLKTLENYFDWCMNCYIFCNKDLVPVYIDYARMNWYNFNILVWCKKQVVPFTWWHHYSDIEYIIYISKTPVFNNWVEWVKYNKYFVLDNEKSKDHPTIKPLEIITNQIQIWSNKEWIVSDSFWWSWSTLIACEKTNRKCYMMELDPIYIEVILKRYHDFTKGNKEIKCLNREIDLSPILNPND
jgi:DNA modification methylase